MPRICVLTLLLIALLAFPDLLHGAGSSEPAAVRAPVRVVLDNNYPPYTFLSEKGVLQGILIDQWKLFEQKTGIKVELIGLDWVEAQRRMRAGEAEVIDTAFDTQERRDWLEFLPPHARIEVPIFFHESVEGITDLSSIRSHEVGVKEGDASIDLLHRARVEKLLRFRNYEEVIAAAKEGELKIFVVDKPAALYFLGKAGIAANYRYTQPIAVGEFHRAVAKGNSAMLVLIQRGFGTLSRAEFEEIDRRWMGSPADAGIPIRTLATILLIAFVVTGTLFAWNQTLRWQVKRSTEALRKSEGDFRRFIEFLPMPLGIGRQDGSVEYLNASFTQTYGYTLADIPDLERWKELAYPDPHYRASMNALWAEDVERAAATGTTSPVREYRIRAKDGSLRDVELATRVSDGRIITTFNDVTKRNITQRQLLQSEERYRRLHESMVDAYVLVSMEGTIIECNRAYEELTGYSEEELRTRRFYDITPEQWHEVETRIITEEVIPHGHSRVYEKEYRHKDGHLIPIEIRTYLYRSEEGPPARMWAIVRDIRERRKLTEQLLQAQKMEAIGQLAGGVAHDFNNILASVLLHVSLLRSDNRDEAAGKSLSEIQAEVERAAELTRQLLAFSRRRSFSLEPVDLQALLERSRRMLQRLLGENISIEIAHAEQVPTVLGHAGSLEQTLMNLALNARDAMPSGGRLTLSIGTPFELTREPPGHPGVKPGKFLRVSVQDTGTGMSPATLAHIFDPFFTTKETGHGTGLGLSIVFNILKQHGGWIEVESIPQEGSCFHLYLQVSGRAPLVIEEGKKGRAPQGRGERILIAEDEVSVRKILQASLTRNGYEVVAAADAQEALLHWEAAPDNFAMLLTDMIMPGGMTGLELARELTGRRPSLKVIISSGYERSLENTSPNFKRLPKPYTSHQLAELVRSTLDS